MNNYLVQGFCGGRWITVKYDVSLLAARAEKRELAAKGRLARIVTDSGLVVS